MTATAASDQNQTAPPTRILSVYFGLVPVLLAIAIIAIIRLFFPTSVIFEPRFLVPVLNSAMFLLYGSIAFAAMKGYLVSGAPTILLLGAGMLTYGLGTIVSGWVLFVSGPDASVAIHNTSALLTSILQIVGVVMTVRATSMWVGTSKKKKAAYLYAGASLAVALVAVLASTGHFPTYFVQGVGPTLLREAVLAIALVLFGLSSFYFLTRYYRTRQPFLYWYGLGLSLIMLCLAAIFLQVVVGSPIGWVGRSAQYLAGIYFLAAVVSVLRSARTQRVSLNESLADLFRKSERRISSILASITDCHYELDHDWRFVRINDQALAYFGRKREEFFGQSYWDIFSTFEGSVFSEHYRKAVSEGVSVHFEAQSAVVPDRWAEIHAYPTEDGGISVFFHDITARKKAEERLEQSNQKISEILNSIQDDFYVLDREWKFVHASKSFTSKIGKEPKDFVGNNIWEMFPKHVGTDFEENLLAAMDKGEVRRFEVGGKYTDAYYTMTVFPSSDGITILGTDITKRKRAEEALQESEAMLRAVLDRMPSGVTVRDARTGALILSNARSREIMGGLVDIPDEFVRYRGFHPNGEEYRTEEWPVSRSMTTGEIVDAEEIQCERSDGTRITLSISSAPIRDSQGQVVVGVGVFHDITTRKRAQEVLRKAHDELEQHVKERTAELSQAYEALQHETEERRKTEEQLRQAQKMEALGTMAGGIAHDFNNILAAVIGFTELLHDHVPEGGREARHTERVLEAALRGRDLVRQMLTFSRRTEQERKPLQLSSIVKESVRLLRASIPTTISIRTSVKSESGVILGDPVQIQQVLMNLATNAAYAMREKGGVLDIELSDFNISSSGRDPHGVEPGLYMKLLVRDTGTGMAPDIIEKIFDPFFTTKGVGEGTGLGLSVVLGIVRQSNGYIFAESELGKGSVFTVYFPKIVGEFDTDATSDDALPTGSERILFVDDEEALVEMGEEILAELGYEVICRMSSRGALTLVQQDASRFDLVVTDQTMPEMTGIELAEAILTIRPDMPIIMCTGFSHLVNEESAREAGINAFVMKPLTKREIAKTVRRVLDE
jgi:PAS domain S-box-containing protein